MSCRDVQSCRTPRLHWRLVAGQRIPICLCIGRWSPVAVFELRLSVCIESKRHEDLLKLRMEPDKETEKIVKGDQMNHSGIAYIQCAPVESISSPVKHHVLELKILQIGTSPHVTFVKVPSSSRPTTSKYLDDVDLTKYVLYKYVLQVSLRAVDYADLIPVLMDAIPSVKFCQGLGISVGPLGFVPNWSGFAVILLYIRI